MSELRDNGPEGTPALLGGSPAVTSEPGDLFAWPIVTERHEAAVLDVLRAGRMSGMDVTRQFERAYADRLGRRFALACNNGTAAIHCALYGLGVGVGDEVISPSMTYWASALPAFSLGASPVFAEIDPATLCVDPEDVEQRITPRTKAIVVVHYAGMPAEMDRLTEIAAARGVPILEDASHAHGALYKGRQVGTFGEVAAFSLMTGKSLAIGEGGILCTDDRRIYERALLFGHYARHNEIELPEHKGAAGLPWGGYKYRMHQLSAAFGLVQLDLYDDQTAEIDRAMNAFCDMIADVPAIEPIRPAAGSGSTKGGWYYPRALYHGDRLGGLSVARFAEAVRAEGSPCNPGCNRPIHTHPLLTTLDVYGHGRPTRLANAAGPAAVDQPAGSLPVTEGINARVCGIPWFKRDRRDIIAQHAAAFRKVAANYEQLLDGDTDGATGGKYSSSR